MFTIEPESELIPPKYGRNFKLIGNSKKKGKVIELFQLTTQVGN